MRFKKLSALATAVLALGLAAPMPAKASDRHLIGHRYTIHSQHDPYAYRYKPNGYYPYYNSGYWRPRHLVKRRRGFRIPRYHQAWGATKRGYKHRRWHNEHHGRHRRWDW